MYFADASVQLKKILIVDDHPIFTKGLEALLLSQKKYEICGSADNRESAVALFEKCNPDLVIVDLNLGTEDGLDIVKDIHSRNPEKAVLVLSMHDEKYYASRAIKAGARGYIMKEESSTQVLNAVQTVLAGGLWLSEQEQSRMKPEDGGIATLSDRQLQIFTMIGKGLGTIEIAAALNVSKKTVDAHKEHIKEKLGCATSQDLRELAIAWTTPQR